MVSDYYDPLITFTDERSPNNTFFWGGWGMGDPAYLRKLEANGLSQLYKEEFLRDNVYFVTVGENNSLYALYSYMEQFYPGVQAQVFDEVEGMYVYRYVLQ